MGRGFALASTALMALAASAANMASQRWVEMKMAELERSLADSTIIAKATQPLWFSMGTNGIVYASLAPRNVAALAVTNSANSTITNGALFAWNGGGVYTNATLGVITATQTNFVWNGIGSTFAEGRCFFAAADGFDVTGTRLTRKEAQEIGGVK